MVSIEIDEKKRKRMLSNRESARRSRMKKQQHLDDLVNMAAQFREENEEYLKQVNITCVKYAKLDAENSTLRILVMELTEKLKYLNSILRFVEEESGMPMDIPEIPDIISNPWRLTCSAQPFLMSPYMFRC